MGALKRPCHLDTKIMIINRFTDSKFGSRPTSTLLRRGDLNRLNAQRTRHELRLKMTTVNTLSLALNRRRRRRTKGRRRRVSKIRGRENYPRITLKKRGDHRAVRVVRVVTKLFWRFSGLPELLEVNRENLILKINPSCLRPS